MGHATRISLTDAVPAARAGVGLPAGRARAAGRADPREPGPVHRYDGSRRALREATSIGVFLGIPLGAAVVGRFALRALASPAWYEAVFLPFVAPWSLVGLLYTILVLFASQGQLVVGQIVSVVRVAVPLTVYFVAIFFVILALSRRLGLGCALSTTQSFTAASNNFELAVATFGPNSDQALAPTARRLIDVPVLIGLIYTMQLLGRRYKWR